VSEPVLVIYADPPWRYSNCAPRPQDRIESKYETMSYQAIARLRLPQEEPAVLYLWSVNPLLREGLRVLHGWGFKYKSNLAWDKKHAALGYWVRSQHELLLIGTRGNASPPDPSCRIPSVWTERSREHSRKPDGIRDRIAAWYPRARKIELFARPPIAEGWETYGNESAMSLKELIK